MKTIQEVRKYQLYPPLTHFPDGSSDSDGVMVTIIKERIKAKPIPEKQTPNERQYHLIVLHLQNFSVLRAEEHQLFEQPWLSWQHNPVLTL